MYNIKDVLTEQQKEILNKENINFDVEIKTDKDMRDYTLILATNLKAFKHIQEIADAIVKYHNENL